VEGANRLDSVGNCVRGASAAHTIARRDEGETMNPQVAVYVRIAARCLAAFAFALVGCSDDPAARSRTDADASDERRPSPTPPRPPVVDMDVHEDTEVVATDAVIDTEPPGDASDASADDVTAPPPDEDIEDASTEPIEDTHDDADADAADTTHDEPDTAPPPIDTSDDADADLPPSDAEDDADADLPPSDAEDDTDASEPLVCPGGHPGVDLTGDGLPDACIPDRGSYIYTRIPVGGLHEAAAVAIHPSNDYVVYLERTNTVRVYDVLEGTHASHALSVGSALYWNGIAFDPSGARAVLVGATIGTTGAGVVYTFDDALWREHGTVEAALAPVSFAPAVAQYVAVDYAPSGEGPYVLSTSTSSPYNFALRVLDLSDEDAVFLGTRASSAGCNDIAFAGNEFGDPGVLVVCGTNGFDSWYYTVVGGVGEWRNRPGNGSLGNTSRAAGHPSGMYALAICWSCDAVYRFEDGLMNGYSDAPRFATRRLWGVSFASDGRRALIFGSKQTISGSAFGTILEYRHGAYACEAPLTDNCGLTEVSIQGFGGAPWIAPNNTRIADVAWRSDCDGGFLVGGYSSFSENYGFLGTFRLEGGVRCD